MSQFIEETISIHNPEDCPTDANTGQGNDYDIPSSPSNVLDDQMKFREDQTRKRIEKMKRANKALFRSDVKPVVVDDFQDLLLPEKLEEIKASKGRLKISKLLYDADQVSDILSMVFTKLIQGAPGDSGSKAVKKNADKFAIDIAPKIAEIRQNPEFKTYRDVATELTRLNITTDRGEGKKAEWQPTSVRNIELRIEKLKKAGQLKPA